MKGSLRLGGRLPGLDPISTCLLTSEVTGFLDVGRIEGGPIGSTSPTASVQILGCVLSEGQTGGHGRGRSHSELPEEHAVERVIMK